MITTNMGRTGGNFYVTATHPAGPSLVQPRLVEGFGEIDPDLFWGDDGEVYVISSPFILYEIELETGELLTESRKVWYGDGGRYVEGPHINKKDGFYYLIPAIILLMQGEGPNIYNILQQQNLILIQVMIMKRPEWQWFKTKPILIFWSPKKMIKKLPL